MPIELYHFIQIWLILDVISALWLGYEMHNAPLLENHTSSGD